MTSASTRSPATTSSISSIERSWPIASGVIESGKTTVSLSGRIGNGVREVRLDGLVIELRRSTSIETAFGPRRRRRDRQHDRQQAALVARGRARDVDVVGERDLALEGAVVELHLLVVAAGRAWPAALAARRRARRGEATISKSSAVDARELDDDRQLGGLVGAVAVDLRAEALAQAREARDLPELGEELLDLAREAVDVAPAGHGSEPTRGSATPNASRIGRGDVGRGGSG